MLLIFFDRSQVFLVPFIIILFYLADAGVFCVGQNYPRKLLLFQITT